MTRKSSVLIVLALAWCAASPCAAQPNIVFILADDMGYGDLGITNQNARAAQGLPSFATPNIDSIATSGVRFNNMYTGAPNCSPSRTVMLTGFHEGHTIFDNASLTADIRAGEMDKTWAQVLQQADYETGFFGKWHLGGVTPDGGQIRTLSALPTQKGFETSYGPMVGSYRQVLHWQSDGSGGMQKYFVPGEPTWTGSGAKVQFGDDLISNRAVDFIRTKAAGSQPFAAYVPFMAPHIPVDQVPKNHPYVDAPWPQVQRDYAGMMWTLDQHVGQILGAINDPNNDGDTSDSVANNTMVIFASDNGGLANGTANGFQPGFFGTNLNYNGAKSIMTEAGIRTPFFVRWNGTIAAGTQNDSFVGSFADLMPTFAEIAGQDVPMGIDGRSMYSDILGGPAGERPDLEFWSQKYEIGGNNPGGWTVRVGDWKLLKLRASNLIAPTVRLFNIANDPRELFNRANTRPDIVAALQAIGIAEGGDREPTGIALDNPGVIEAKNTYFTQYKNWSPQGGSTDFAAAANWGGGTLRGEPADPVANNWNTGPADNWLATMVNGAGAPQQMTLGADAEVLALGVEGPSAEMRLVVPAGRRLTARNGVRISAGGIVQLHDGELNTIREIDVRPGGTLDAQGVITGQQAIIANIPEFASKHLLEPKVINAGEINIGDGATAGILTVDGEYEQRSTGMLHFDLFGRGGVAGVDFDRLGVSRTAALGGALEVALAPGVQLDLGDTFPILSAAGGITGTFNTASMAPLLPGLSWNISYSPTTVTLTVIEQALTNLTIAPGQPLGASVTIEAGQTVDLAGFLRVGQGASPGSLTINSGGQIHVAGSTTINSAGVLTLAGGTLQTGLINKVAGGSLNWSSGRIHVTGNLAVAPGQGLGDALVLAHGQTLDVDGILSVSAGTLEINSGGIVEAGGGVTVASGSMVTLNGGRLTTSDLDAAAGTFHWTGGALELIGDTTIAAGEPLGASVTLGSQKTLEVNNDLYIGNGTNPGALTIEPGGAAVVGHQTVIAPAGVVTLSGGSLTTGRLVNSPGGTFDWQSGRLGFTGNLSIAPGADLGASAVISNGRTLDVGAELGVSGGTLSVDAGGVVEVAGATTISNGGLLTLAGGRLSTASLVQQGSGQLAWTGGTLAFTGNLSVAAGGDLGATLSMGAGRTLEVAHNLGVQAGGVLTLAGGEITAESLSNFGGAVTWTTGRLNVTSNLVIATGQAFEYLSLGADQVLTAANLQVADGIEAGVLSINAGATVGVSGAINIDNSGVLELNGGSLTASTITRGASGSLRFWAGSLNLTGPNALIVGADGLMGTAVTISPDRSLTVAGPIVVVTGGTLSDYGGQITTSLLQLDGGEFYSPDFAGIGAVTFNSGKITMSGDFALTSNGALGSDVLMSAGRTLDVIGALSVGQSGGSQVNLVIGAGGVVDAGAVVTVRSGHMLALNGGRLETSSLAGEAGAAFVWNTGTLRFTNNLAVAAAGDLGAAVTLGSGQTLEIANQMQIDGSLTLNTGSESSSDVTSVGATGAVHLAGGKLSTASLNLDPAATFDWQFGELHDTGDLAIGAGGAIAQALGGQLQIGPTHHLSVAGVATLNAPLTLAGGTLSVGQLANAGLLVFNSGTLNLTGPDLLVDAGGPLGPVLAMQPSQTLNVTGATIVAPGALATIANGSTLSSHAINNNGEISLAGPLANLETAAGLTNNGSVGGKGGLGGPVVNAETGHVTVDAGARLNFLGSALSNAGQILATGSASSPAELDFDGLVTNVAGGQMSISHARVRFNAGISNQWSLSVTGGENQVHGAIANTGDIVVTGGASVTFYDDVEQNGYLSVARVGDVVSTAIFLGDVTGASGATGGGNVYFEGNLSPGNSPALVSYAGNVYFGGGSRLKIELGGILAGVNHDAITVAGSMTLDGVLDVSLINAYTPVAGQSFTIIESQGGLVGAFDAVMLPSIPSIAWNVERTATSLILHSFTPAVSADFDGDGRVTGDDFLVWQRGLGTSNAQRSQGDANGDLVVDAADLAIWRARFGGASANAAAQAVPEPASAWLAASAALVVLGSRQARRRAV